MADMAVSTRTELELLRLREQEFNIARTDQPTGGVQPRERATGAILPELAAVAPELVGAYKGAKVGGRVGARFGPYGAAAGTAIGAGLGAGLGETIEQIGRRTLQEKPPTTWESAKEVALTTGLGMLGEVGTFGLAAIAKPFVKGRALSKAVTPEGREAIEFLAKRGATPPVAKVTKSRALDILENVAEESFTGVGRMAALKETAEGTAENVIRNFVAATDTGVGRSQLGSIMQDAIEEGTESFGMAAKGLYKVVDNLTAPTLRLDSLTGKQALVAGGVNINRLKILAGAMLKQTKKGLPSGKSRSLLKSIIDKPNSVPWEDAQILRSDLLGVTRQTTDLVSGKATGLARKLSGELDGAMQEASKELAPDALKAWRRANSFYKAGKGRFNDAMLKTVIKQSPDAAVDVLLRQKTPSSINKIMKLVKTKEAKSAIQHEFLEQVMRASADDVTKELSGARILTKLKNFDKGRGNLHALFRGNKDLGEFRKAARVLSTLQKKQPTKIGALGVQIAQTGAVLSLASTVPLVAFGQEGIGKAVGGGSLLILFAPGVLSRALTNPRIVNAMLKGSKIPRAAGASTKFMIRLSALMAKEGIKHNLQTSSEEVNKYLESNGNPRTPNEMGFTPRNTGARKQ